MLNRAYSVLVAKATASDDGRRRFEGIATTPTPDRIGDVIDPMGAQFKTPLPLLHQHDHETPIGTVILGKPTKKGISFEAEIPVVHEPGPLKDRLDLAWGEIKAGLVRAVSIGFRPLKDGYEVMKDGGLLFKGYEILELSTVSIPANAECQIAVVKSIDTAMRAAIGETHADDATPPGAAGPRRTPVVKATKDVSRKTYAEQISAFEATLKLKTDRMDDILTKAAEDGATLDAAQKEEYDDLEAETKSIEDHLVRLRAREAANVAMARSVSDAPTPQALSDVRGAPPAESHSTTARIPAQVKAVSLPKGTAFTRYVMALGRARGSLVGAVEIAKQWKDSTPEVEMHLRAAMAAGTTTDSTWASPLVPLNTLASEFIELLRPATILGRINGLRRIPFNVKVPRQTAGASAGWVGEGAMKPVSSLAFDTITFGWYKVAAIVAITDELLRFSSPSAEDVIRADLVKTVAQFIDLEFIDPSKAASAGSSPASITYGVTPVTASGTTASAFRADIISLMKSFAQNYIPLSSGVWIMSMQQALAISMMLNELGQQLYPSITPQGGTLMGMPVITSENVPTVGNSPADGSRIILVDASQILLADDGGVTVDMSNEASLQMDSTPDSPPTASTNFVSLWQTNMTAFRIERYINWALRHTGAVGYINGALYAQ
jgi:HK97 family phage major capsid protein/HK97 family phage prohead protease